MKPEHIKDVIAMLKFATKPFSLPLIDILIKDYGRNPFLILIGCLLSLRVKDLVTIHVCRSLFARATTPEALLAITQTELEQIIFRCGFYKNKARVLRDICHDLLTRFNGNIPQTKEELLSMKGIGAKTANLVLGMAFKIPAICVDTHVHRISNRLGLISTNTVEETEKVLTSLLPKEYWIQYNTLLVIWGQNICVPISPKCSQCRLVRWCHRVDVKKSR